MAVPEDTGYPLRWFKQMDFVRNLYECAICLEVIKDAVQIRDCGHQFCRYCLDGVLRSNEQPECPTCRNRISNEDVFSDNAAMRQIGNLAVNCPNNGCEWDGTLNFLLQEHTGMCPFLLLPCSNVGCDEQVTRRDLEAHLAGCEYRIVICRYCNSEHVFKDEAEHLEVCLFLPVECTNGCPKTIPRIQMLEHLETVCIKTVVKCNYTDFGCKYQCERQELEEHLNQEMRHHLELSTLEISIMKLKCDQYEKDMQEMKKECVRYENDKKEMKQRCDQYEKDIQEMNQKRDQYEKDMQEMKKKCGQYENDMEEMKQKLNTAPHLMIIRDFNKTLLEAKAGYRLGVVHSDPFYSSTYGYKMRMFVHLNEYNNHMGVYISIMKSDHDAILSWPFDKKFTFTLIDQYENERERENIMTTVLPLGEDDFKRPLLGETKGLGRAKFVSHETLQTRQYVKDDTVFIKFNIET